MHHLLPNIIYWFKRNNNAGSIQKNVNFGRTRTRNPEGHTPTHRLWTIYTKPFKSKVDLAEAKMIIDDLLRTNAITRNQYNKLCIIFTINPKFYF